MWKMFLFMVHMVWPIVATLKLEMHDVIALWTDESAQFVCRVRSELKPTISIQFWPCDEQILYLSDCKKNITSVDVKFEHTNDAIEYKAYGKIAPPKFGVAFCYGNNSQGSSMMPAKLYPVHSYQQLELEILSPTGVVHKADTAVFRCRANAYNFTNRFVLTQGRNMLEGIGHMNKYAWEVNFTTEILAGRYMTCRAYHKKGGFQNVTLDLGEEFNPVNKADARSVQSLLYVFFGGCLVVIVGLVWFWCSSTKQHANVVEEVKIDAQDDAEDDDEDAQSFQACNLVSTIPPESVYVEQ